MDERVGDRAGLGDTRRRRRAAGRVDSRRLGGGFVVQVDHAHAVGPDRARPWRARDQGNSRLHTAAASPPSTTPPPGMITRARRRGGLLRDAAARNGLMRRATCPGAPGAPRGRGSTAGRAAHHSAGSRSGSASAAHHPEVVADGLGDPAAGRCPDDGDERGANSGRRSIAAARARLARRDVARRPRSSDDPVDAALSSARAMMSRWISDVPSQIRSTRSSRKNRSAAYSRM